MYKVRAYNAGGIQVNSDLPEHPLPTATRIFFDILSYANDNPTSTIKKVQLTNGDKVVVEQRAGA
jgi:hypothetical protein